MFVDRIQRQRFELKYRISPAAALAVRDAVRGRLEPDPFARSRPDLAYPIHSLYLDTDNLRLYRATINGDKNRFKLRIRYYDESPASPAFLEIKSRVNDCILKKRAAVRRETLPELMRHGWPALRHLHLAEARQLDAAHMFCRLVHDLQAHPRSHVAYHREAWVSHADNAVRVTLDRDVRCEPQDGTVLTTCLRQPARVFPADTVILEIKFTDHFPAWLAEMVQMLGLTRTSAAKYVDGVTGMGEEHFHPRTITPSRLR